MDNPFEHKFILKEKFRPDDDLSIILLRLMAAYNDILTANKEYIRRVYSDNEKTMAEKNYFMRLATGHLYEGVVVFKHFKQGKGRDIINKMSPHGKEAYDKLEKILLTNGFAKMLKEFRSKMAFHYQNEDFKKALQSFDDTYETKIVIGERGDRGSVRFLIADEVVNRIIDDISQSHYIEISKMVKKIAELHEWFYDFIDEFVTIFLKNRKEGGTSFSDTLGGKPMGQWEKALSDFFSEKQVVVLASYTRPGCEGHPKAVKEDVINFFGISDCIPIDAVMYHEVKHRGMEVDRKRRKKEDSLKEIKTNPSFTHKCYFEGGSGNTIERAVVIRGASEHKIGMLAEYQYLTEKFGRRSLDWKLEGQALLEYNGRPYDELHIKLSDGSKKTVIFDLTEFFGRWGGRQRRRKT